MRFAMGLLLAAGLAAALNMSELLTPLALLGAAAVAWFAWVVWDESRGRTHRIAEARERFAGLGGVADGDDALKVPWDARGDMGLRFAVDRQGTATVAALWPVPTSTVSFRLWPSFATRPGFDGQEPAVGGPRLERLPGVEAILGELFAHDGVSGLPTLHCESNAPERLVSALNPAVRAALADVLRNHGQGFRGISFDGNVLAVHWTGTALEDPPTTLASTRQLLAAWLPAEPLPPHAMIH
jgi:hypothetical protein